MLQQNVSVSSTKNQHSILLAENNNDWCDKMTSYLSSYAFSVQSFNNGDGVMNGISTLNPEVVLLDTKLSGKDGFEICRELRAAGNNVPIMFLGDQNEDFDHVLGLELGADDYQAKPIQPRVLLARIKALLRRAEATDSSVNESILQFGKLRIQITNREVKLGDARIALTPAEFDLLWLLASNAGKVMHRNDILQSLRGLQLSDGDRSVDARLYRLRRRFEHLPEAQHKIKTIRPHGYMFCMEPW